MAAVTLSLIGFFSFLMVRMTTPQMVPLFTDLSLDDSAAIVKDLDRQAITYEIKGNGTSILVPKEKVGRLRIWPSGPQRLTAAAAAAAAVSKRFCAIR